MRDLLRTLAGNRFARFAIVGCSNALIGYVVFAFLMRAHFFPDNAKVELAQGSSYGVGLAWAFLWSRYWTFRKPSRKGGRLPQQTIRFVIVQGACLLLSIVLVSLAIDGLRWDPLPGWLAAMSVVTVVSYLATAFWVFPGSAFSPRQQRGEIW